MLEVRTVGQPRLQLSGVAVRSAGRGGALSVSYALSKPARVQMTVVSPAGRVVRTAGPVEADAGSGALELTARGALPATLSRGMYLLKIVAEDDTGQRIQAARAFAVR